MFKERGEIAKICADSVFREISLEAKMRLIAG
jgi:hypothetical protein